MEIPKSRGSKKAAAVLDVKNIRLIATQIYSIISWAVLTLIHGSLGT